MKCESVSRLCGRDSLWALSFPFLPLFWLRSNQVVSMSSTGVVVSTALLGAIGENYTISRSGMSTVIFLVLQAWKAGVGFSNPRFYDKKRRNRRRPPPIAPQRFKSSTVRLLAPRAHVATALLLALLGCPILYRSRRMTRRCAEELKRAQQIVCELVVVPGQ